MNLGVVVTSGLGLRKAVPETDGTPSQKDIVEMEKDQKRVTKMIKGLKKFLYEERLEHLVLCGW